MTALTESLYLPEAHEEDSRPIVPKVGETHQFHLFKAVSFRVMIRLLTRSSRNRFSTHLSPLIYYSFGLAKTQSTSHSLLSIVKVHFLI